MPEAHYIIGIDLGTSNTVVAYTEASVKRGDKPEVSVFQIPQLVSAGEVAGRDMLPSFIYLPGKHEENISSLTLPWDGSNDIAVGEMARNRGAEVPDKFVSSAKSWLCNSMVNRTHDILPWGASDDSRKISPVEASCMILKHVRDAWNHEIAGDVPELMMEFQEIYLTVPASFDADARELTVKAARAAGLENVTLLEEPQAAFYAWIASTGEDWREKVSPGDSILICDIGGGTTDFSLIEVSDEGGDLGLERVAVGDHLLVGGDNMDLALAYSAAASFAKKGVKIDAWQMRALGQSCRSAKEKLLGSGAPEEVPVSVLGRGSSLIGGTVKTNLVRQEIESLVINGFFPQCQPTDSPVKARQSGLKEFGLSYEADAAITRHLARFLRRGGHQAEDLHMPTAVFFNGGVMKADTLRKRVIDVLNSWGGSGIREIESSNLDLSVATGAAFYGFTKKSGGVRIRGGLAKTYYVSIAASMPAIPGIPLPTKALCVAPFGMEEGTEAEVKDSDFVLVVGENVHFDVLRSSTRLDDKTGDIVDDWNEEIEELTTIETVLDGDAGEEVPVGIKVRATEIGTLDFWCVSRNDDRKWRLEFSVREREPVE